MKKVLLDLQRTEITEYEIYSRLAEKIKDPKNKKLLKHIAKDEMDHYRFWKKYTKQDVKPKKLMIWKHVLLRKVFGIVFSLKLMGKQESCVACEYDKLVKTIPEVKKVKEDEIKHEKALINLIEEDRLKYLGSIVLGLNDALVELTGVLAGLTLAFQNPRIIAVAGLITGIAASLSMGGSEYLSTKTEKTKRRPVKAAIFTAIAYFFTVLFLIFPYFVLSNVMYSLAWTLVNAIIVILVFSYYNAVANDRSFKRHFFEMFVISMGVAALSFAIGFLLRSYIGIEV